VHEVLTSIGADLSEELLVFNKSDLGPGAAHEAARHPGSVAVSAVTGAGVEELVLRIGDRLRALTPAIELLVPYDRGDVLAAIHRNGEVLSELAVTEGMQVSARLDPRVAGRFGEFALGGATS
jgi:GTP-binding protein HflX